MNDENSSLAKRWRGFALVEVQSEADWERYRNVWAEIFTRMTGEVGEWRRLGK